MNIKISRFNLKKHILKRQQIVGTLSLLFGLIGFILMILENEFTINSLYDKVVFMHCFFLLIFNLIFKYLI